MPVIRLTGLPTEKSVAKQIHNLRAYLRTSDVEKFWINEVSDTRGTNLKEVGIEVPTEEDTYILERFFNKVPYKKGGVPHYLQCEVVNHDYSYRSSRSRSPSLRGGRRSLERSYDDYSMSSRDEYDGTSQIDVEIEFIKKKRQILEEETRLIEKRQQLEMLQEAGPSAQEYDRQWSRDREMREYRGDRRNDSYSPGKGPSPMRPNQSSRAADRRATDRAPQAGAPFRASAPVGGPAPYRASAPARALAPFKASAPGRGPAPVRSPKPAGGPGPSMVPAPVRAPRPVGDPTRVQDPAPAKPNTKPKLSKKGFARRSETLDVPLFLMPCKHLLKEYRAAVLKVVRGKGVKPERKMVTKMLRAHLRRELALALEHKQYMPTAAIIMLYREHFPRKGDEALVQRMFNDLQRCFWPLHKGVMPKLKEIKRRKAAVAAAMAAMNGTEAEVKPEDAEVKEESRAKPNAQIDFTADVTVDTAGQTETEPTNEPETESTNEQSEAVNANLSEATSVAEGDANECKKATDEKETSEVTNVVESINVDKESCADKSTDETATVTPVVVDTESTNVINLVDEDSVPPNETSQIDLSLTEDGNQPIDQSLFASEAPITVEPTIMFDDSNVGEDDWITDGVDWNDVNAEGAPDNDSTNA